MNARTKQKKALLAIISCVLFWGFSFISIKKALAVYPPMSLGFLRFALAAAFFLILIAVLRLARVGEGGFSGGHERLELRDLPWLAGGGLAGDTLYFFFENNGVSLITASEASLISGTIPVIAMIAERVERKIRRREAADGGGAWRWIGALFSAAGVWLIAGASVSASGSAKGYLFMAGAAVSWVAYCFLTRPLFTRHSQLFIVFWQTLFGLAGFTPFALAEIPRWGTPNAALIVHIAFLGLCCSALGYWLYNYALKILDVSVSSVFINLIPVVTVIAGYILLGDRLSPPQWAGAVLVIVGVWLAMRRM
jgi:drug/metabolite transporter (DMT)-like permease